MKKIIVAPLNWGLGHASRCVPIIHFLIENNYTLVLASDGAALKFLQKEFPELPFLELPSYDISYQKNLKWGLFLKIPKIWKAVKQEEKVIANYIEANSDVAGLISDNRFGVRSKKKPSIYMTHQIQVFAGAATFLTSFFHQRIIKTFDECWIPDTIHSDFSGNLSDLSNSNIKVKYIGVLSRFKAKSAEQIIDVLILLSGIEPNRTDLEIKLKKVFKDYPGKVLMVLGRIENQQTRVIEEGIEVVNFLLSEALEEKLLSAKLVVCRSGYSSIMDLAVLQKKVIFIPTKNQSEQEYLAKLMMKTQRAPFQKETDFSIKSLDLVATYNGLKAEQKPLAKELLRLF